MRWGVAGNFAIVKTPTRSLLLASLPRKRGRD